MRSRSLLFLVALFIPVAAFAVDNVGECGWGSKLFEGDRGIAPQVLAVTTNGTFGNQTFGITSGTSGCTQDGVVRSNWKTVSYIDGNMNRFARDLSRGQGETINGLASLLGVPEAQQPAFAAYLQSHFGEIFRTPDVTSGEVASGIRNVLLSDPQYASYASMI